MATHVIDTRELANMLQQCLVDNATDGKAYLKDALENFDVFAYCDNHSELTGEIDLYISNGEWEYSFWGGRNDVGDSVVELTESTLDCICSDIADNVSQWESNVDYSREDAIYYHSALEIVQEHSDEAQEAWDSGIASGASSFWDMITAVADGILYQLAHYELQELAEWVSNDLAECVVNKYSLPVE